MSSDDIHQINVILQKFTGTARKRKRQVFVGNVAVQYVTALLQPHVVAGTDCDIPFDIITSTDNVTVYNVEGNPPVTTLTVTRSSNAITDFRMD
jgi:hypothetical protein